MASLKLVEVRVRDGLRLTLAERAFEHQTHVILIDTHLAIILGT